RRSVAAIRDGTRLDAGPRKRCCLRARLSLRTDRLENLVERAIATRPADQVREQRRVPPVAALVSCDPGDFEENVGLLPGKLFVAADCCGDSLQPVVHRALQHNRGVPRALWTKAPLALLRHRVGLVAVLCA